jgi:hypothetical protein
VSVWQWLTTPPEPRWFSAVLTGAGVVVMVPRLSPAWEPYGTAGGALGAVLCGAASASLAKWLIERRR